MARSDWNRYDAADTNHTLSTQQVYEGVTSLKMANADVDSEEILSISEQDAPTEGRVKLRAKSDRTAGFYTFFRFQDVDNYYVLGFSYGGSSNAEVNLSKNVGGFLNTIATYSLSGSNAANQTLSDGSVSGNVFGLYRASLWIDSAGDLRGRIEEDTDGDGLWSQLGNDMVDTSPDLGSGGGIGVGGQSGIHSYDGDQPYYDNTQVFY